MLTIDDYRTALHDPKTWITRSVSLFQSAEAVWEAGKSSGYKPGANIPLPESPLHMIQCFGFYRVAMMLYGLSVETALKGILVSSRSDKITVTLETDGGGIIQRVSLKAIGDSGGGHNLIALAKNAGVISLNDNQDVQEKLHLQELSDYVVWRGRYPVPKTLSAGEENQEGQKNVETIAFVRVFLHRHLKWPA
jgi:hypothetical protein